MLIRTDGHYEIRIWSRPEKTSIQDVALRPLKYMVAAALVAFLVLSGPFVRQGGGEAVEPAASQGYEEAAGLEGEMLPEDAGDAAAGYFSDEDGQNSAVARERMLEEEAEPADDSFPEYDEETLELERELLMEGEEEDEGTLLEEDEEFTHFAENSIMAEDEVPSPEVSVEPEDPGGSEERGQGIRSAE